MSDQPQRLGYADCGCRRHSYHAACDDTCEHPSVPSGDQPRWTVDHAIGHNGLWEMQHPKGRFAEVAERLAAAEAVIRHYADGWMALDESKVWYLESGMDDDPGDWDGQEPMSDAEAEAIARARGEQP